MEKLLLNFKQNKLSKVANIFKYPKPLNIGYDRTDRSIVNIESQYNLDWMENIDYEFKKYDDKPTFNSDKLKKELKKHLAKPKFDYECFEFDKSTLFLNDKTLKSIFLNRKESENWFYIQENVILMTEISPSVPDTLLNRRIKGIFGDALLAFEVFSNNLSTNKLAHFEEKYKTPKIHTMFEKQNIAKSLHKMSKFQKQGFENFMEIYYNGFDKWPTRLKEKSTCEVDGKLRAYWLSRKNDFLRITMNLNPLLFKFVQKHYWIKHALYFQVIHKKYESFVVLKKNYAAGRKAFSPERILTWSNPCGISNWRQFNFYGYNTELPFTKPITLPGIGLIHVQKCAIAGVIQVNVYKSKEGKFFLEMQNETTRRLDKLKNDRIKDWEFVDKFYSYYGAKPKIEEKAKNEMNEKLDFLQKKNAMIYLRDWSKLSFRNHYFSSLGINFERGLVKLNKASNSIRVKKSSFGQGKSELLAMTEAFLDKNHFKKFEFNWDDSTSVLVSFMNFGEARRAIVLMMREKKFNVEWGKSNK